MTTSSTHARPPRPLTVGAVLAASSRVVVTVAGATATIVLARVLGPEGWATYFIGQSLFLILLAATTLGVESGIAYFVGSARWGARAAFRSALRVAALMGVVGALVGTAARLLVPSAFAGLSVWLTVAVVAALPLGLAWFYTSFVAVATDRYEVSSSLPAIQSAAVLALAVPGALAFDIEGAVVGASLGTVVAGVVAIVWGNRRLPPDECSEPGQLRRAIAFGIKTYRNGSPLRGLPPGSLRAVCRRLRRVAWRLLARGRTHFAPVAIAASAVRRAPAAGSSPLQPGGQGIARRRRGRGLRHASLVTIVGALSLAAALELLVVPVFGEGFRPAVNLGLILLPGSAAIAITLVLAATVVGRGKPAYALYGALVMTPVTVVLYATLIPWLEANGAALASTISLFGDVRALVRLLSSDDERRVAPHLIPTRWELQDLRALLRQALDRVSQIGLRT